MRKDYTRESEKVAKAIDIAIKSFIQYPPSDFNEVHVNQFVNVYNDYKDRALNPLPEFKNLTSLKYIINDILTFFQESKGEAVEIFWKRVDEEKLGYKSEDKLRKILDRGKIRGDLEYELAVDSVVAAEQEGKISREDSCRLAELIGKYEFSKGNNNRGNKK